MGAPPTPTQGSDRDMGQHAPDRGVREPLPTSGPGLAQGCVTLRRLGCPEAAVMTQGIMEVKPEIEPARRVLPDPSARALPLLSLQLTPRRPSRVLFPAPGMPLLPLLFTGLRSHPHPQGWARAFPGPRSLDCSAPALPRAAAWSGDGRAGGWGAEQGLPLLP